VDDAFDWIAFRDSKESRELLRGPLEEDGCLKVIGGLFSFKDIIDPNLDAIRLMSWERIVELLDGAGTLLAHGTKIEEGDDIQSVVDFVYADIRSFIGHGLEIFVVSLSRQKEGDEENDHGCDGQDEKSHSENEWPI
jgi:hypothetical protein